MSNEHGNVFFFFDHLQAEAKDNIQKASHDLRDADAMLCQLSYGATQLHGSSSLSSTIVNLGSGYETPGISKAGTIQSQLDVEPTVTLHNLLNKCVEAFDWLSYRKKCVFVGFCAGSRPKKRTKT